jgi:hypothetical protein
MRPHAEEVAPDVDLVGRPSQPVSICAARAGHSVEELAGCGENQIRLSPLATRNARDQGAGRAASPAAALSSSICPSAIDVVEAVRALPHSTDFAGTDLAVEMLFLSRRIARPSANPGASMPACNRPARCRAGSRPTSSRLRIAAMEHLLARLIDRARPSPACISISITSNRSTLGIAESDGAPEASTNPGGDFGEAVRIGEAVKDEHELIAADPRGTVALAHAGAQPFGPWRREDFIARRGR